MPGCRRGREEVEVSTQNLGPKAVLRHSPRSRKPEKQDCPLIRMTRNWFTMRERGADLDLVDLGIIGVLAHVMDNRTGVTFTGVNHLAKLSGRGRKLVMQSLARLRTAGIITGRARSRYDPFAPTPIKTTDEHTACPLIEDREAGSLPAEAA
jgi:hypothetical protein